MSLKAVFIDVGNTLLYEKPSRFEIYAERARQRAVEVDETAMRGLMHRAHRELPIQIGGAFRYSDPWFDAYIGRIYHDYLGLEEAALGAIRSELFARFSEPATFALFPGTIELLEGLRARGLRLVVVSNWSARLPMLLERLDLARRIDFVVCSAIERLEKPDPLIFDKALRLAGVRADETLHAGDDFEKDVLGAQRVGIRAVLVDHARHASALRKDAGGGDARRVSESGADEHSAYEHSAHEHSAHEDSAHEGGAHAGRAGASHAPRVTSLSELAQVVERLMNHG